MGEIVAFRQRAASASPAPIRPDGEAQILFFLGVRYVRMDEAQETAPRDEMGGAHDPRTNRGGKRRRRAKAS